MNVDIGSDEMEDEDEQVDEGDDASDDESMYECGDEIYATDEEEDQPAPPVQPARNATRSAPVESEVQMCEPFWCCGVITPMFDDLDAWEDGETEGRSRHHIVASVGVPRSVIETKELIQGQWHVKHTMCKSCYRIEKKHQKEGTNYPTSGLSLRAYCAKLDKERYVKAQAKERRTERVESAKKRMKTLIECEAPLATPKAEPKESAFVTPIKNRPPSSAPQSCSSSSTAPATTQTTPSLTTSPPYRSALMTTLRAGLASAEKKLTANSSTASASNTAPDQQAGTSYASVSTPHIIVDLTTATSTDDIVALNAAPPPVLPTVADPIIGHAAPAATVAAPAVAPAPVPAAPGDEVLVVPAPAAAAAAAVVALPTTAQVHRDQLIAWNQAVRTHLKVSELKDLCRANKLMVSGSKAELKLRLLKCKYHGSPGLCLLCRQPKIECTYPREDLLEVPLILRCKHMRGQGVYCSYGIQMHKSYFLKARQDPQPHALPLVDTADGVLLKWNISTGSILA